MKLPDYDLGPAGNAMRQEVREWLEANWYGERKAAHESLPFEKQGFDKEFGQDLVKQGWIGLAWPKVFGGQERTPFEQLAYVEEMDGSEVPLSTLGAGPQIIAPAIMVFGTPEQKEKYIRAIAQNEAIICLGYSEPESGSDLASLRTKAVQDGDDWVINGQKIWVTLAEESNYIWLAVRTDPEAKPPHAGISMFLVPMDTQGISVVPSMAMYGHTFSNIFFDDVRVPSSAMIGKVNGGWKVIIHALASERILMGGHLAKSRSLFDQLTDYIKSASVNSKPLSSNAVIRDRIGALAAELEVARQFVLRSVRMAEEGKVPIHEAAMAKAFSSELQQRITETALDVLGMGGTLSHESASAPLGGKIEQKLRQSIMMVVGGGTSEIQRSLIATLGLGLPR
jgi:alkylation response protein AidB-like acyl-CoA dehydrogenase